MFIKNAAVVGFQIGHFIQTADGAAKTTGTPTCKRLLDGVGAALTNAASYSSDGGAWEIDLDAADMDADLIGLSFALADCLPISYTIRTTTLLVDASGAINSVSGSVGGVTGLTPATVAAAILATPAYKLATLSGGEIVISPETVVAAYVENLSPTAQQEAANGVNNLAPASTGATGSIRAKLDAIKLITDAIDTSAVTITSTNNAGVLTFTKGVTFAATVSGLTISGTWTKLYFTLKESDYDTDDLALIQIVETNPGAGADGLLYLDGAAIASPITVADGTLTVNQAAGTVAIALTDNATSLLAKTSSLVWDIKTKDAVGATVQNATGTASITQSVTQTI